MECLKGRNHNAENATIIEADEFIKNHTVPSIDALKFENQNMFQMKLRGNELDLELESGSKESAHQEQ